MSSIIRPGSKMTTMSFLFKLTSALLSTVHGLVLIASPEHTKPSQTMKIYGYSTAVSPSTKYLADHFAPVRLVQDGFLDIRTVMDGKLIHRFAEITDQITS